MSEYQYYEFRAIDRSLTEREIRELRELSTRAQITPFSFTNFYNWGDFRGSPEALMEKYFDAFLYYANWGTRRLMLRLPRRLVDIERASLYCPGESSSLRVKGDAVLLEFVYNNEEPGEDDGTLGSMIPLRADLLAGDLRALYLGWLLSVEMGDPDDEEEEPPVPAGLGELTDSLESLAKFLQIDENLIAVAAERSPPRVQSQPSREEWIEWIHRLPEREKEALLLRVAEGQDPHLRGELLQRFQQEAAAAAGAESGEAVTVQPRTVGELLAAAEQRGEEQRHLAAERQAAEQARREREQAAARAKYLEGLQGREPEIWRRVEALIDTKRPKDYDQAVTFLEDLRDLAVRLRRETEFQARIGALRQRHALKVSLLERLNRAGVGSVSDP